MTSRTDPRAKATTGVPQAIDSIITRPKGSGHSTGKSTTAASPRKRSFCTSSISPMNSISGSSSSGLMRSAKYCSSTLSTLAAILSGIPTRRAISMARSGPFSGEMRPRKARYRPGPG